MQITETSAEGLTRKFQVVIGAADIDQRIQKKLAEIAKTIRLSGFRPGKVPVSVIKQRYGRSVLGEVIEQTVNESSSETLKDKNLRPALEPKIEISNFEEGKDLVYDLQVEILPELESPDLSSITLERLRPEIGDAEIDEAVTRLAERYRKAETITDGSSLALGDTAVIDFKGSIDGEEFAGGAGTDHALELGSNRFIPGFEEQIVGAKAGEDRVVKVTFPADYGATHLAGKEAEFAVTVKAVQRKGPATIDDSLAEEVGMENLEALRTAIRDQMAADYDRVARQRLKRDLLDHLAEKYQFNVPPGMVEIEFSSIWREFEAEKKRAEEAGTYQPEEGKTEDDIKAEYRAIADRRVRLGLLLAEIGKNANIQVAQDELNRAVSAQVRQYPGQEKAVMDYYRAHPEAMQALRAPLYEDKVVDYVFENAAVTEKSLPLDQFMTAVRLDDEDDE